MRTVKQKPLKIGTIKDIKHLKKKKLILANLGSKNKNAASDPVPLFIQNKIQYLNAYLIFFQLSI